MNEHDFGFRQDFEVEAEPDLAIRELRTRIFVWLVAGVVIAGTGLMLFG